MPKVLESFFRLAITADFIIIEGAGSPAEINLREGDIANMGFAEAANIPVVLIGDIDRGGVIAQMVGTNIILTNDSEESKRRDSKKRYVVQNLYYIAALNQISPSNDGYHQSSRSIVATIEA